MPGVRPLRFPHDILRRSLRHDAAAGVAAFGAEVDDPIRLGNDIQVVLDHDDGVAGIDQAVQHGHELLDVGHVQTDGRLVQHVQRMHGRSSGHGFRPGQLRDELDALRLTAAQCGTLLSQSQVAKPYVVEQLQRVVSRPVRGKELHGLVNVHVEHVGNRPAAELHRQRFGIEALPAARLATHRNIRQETHLDLLHPLPLTRLAPPPFHVEGKAARLVSAHARFRRLRKQPPDAVPESHVRGGTRARRLADGRLVHFQYTAHRLPPLDCAASGKSRCAFTPFAPPLPHHGRQARTQHVLHQRAFAAATDAGHTHEPPQRHPHIEVLQIVEPRSPDRHEPLASAFRNRSPRRNGMRQWTPQIASRDGASVPDEILDAPLGHNATPEPPAARTQVYDVFRTPNGRLVMFHDNHRVALLLQPDERIEQHKVIARVQPDRGFIQDVAHAAQVRSELRRQPDALGLAAAEGRRRTPQRQVRQPDLDQEPQPRPQFAKNIAGYVPFPSPGPQTPEVTFGRVDRLRGEIRDRTAPEPHRQRLGPQPAPVANPARHLGTTPPRVPPRFLPRLRLVEPAQFQAGPETPGTPAMLAVERKEAGVELIETARA